MGSEKETNVTCSHCGYSWFTESKLLTLTCPSCCGKTKNTTVDQLIQTQLLKMNPKDIIIKMKRC